MDFAVVKDANAATVSISNETDGLCAVRVTKMSDGITQYQSNITFSILSNKKTAFTFPIIISEYYMIEAWTYNSSANKLIPAVVKYV